MVFLVGCGVPRSDGDSDSDESVEEVPAEEAFCHEVVEGWSDFSSYLEEGVFDATNEARATGRDCGSEGWFDATEPLEWNTELRCSARYHTWWMSENEDLSHVSPGGDFGQTLGERTTSAGFLGSVVAENIAWGPQNAEEAVAGWLMSDGHCANIMDPGLAVLGVGFVDGDNGPYWTQNFGGN